MRGDTRLLTGRGLRKSFGPTPALRGMDLRVDAGEVLAVMGPSGSGKSTLLHCLAGILTPDAGEVTFDGRRVDQLSDRERSRLWRTEFGFVFQFGQLVPELPCSRTSRCRCCSAGRDGGPRWRRPSSGCPGSGWTASGTACRASLPAGRASAWRSPVR